MAVEARGFITLGESSQFVDALLGHNQVLALYLGYVQLWPTDDDYIHLLAEDSRLFVAEGSTDSRYTALNADTPWKGEGILVESEDDIVFHETKEVPIIYDDVFRGEGILMEDKDEIVIHETKEVPIIYDEINKKHTI